MATVKDERPVEINISREKVCFIVELAREFDAAADLTEPDLDSSPPDTGEPEVLEGNGDSPLAAELRETINDLNDDEVIDVIAMVWVGRGDFTKSEWQSARNLARQRHHRQSADYLMGMPTLGDLLEDGLTQLGHACE
jgi:hypothetical protein